MFSGAFRIIFIHNLPFTQSFLIFCPLILNFPPCIFRPKTKVPKKIDQIRKSKKSFKTLEIELFGAANKDARKKIDTNTQVHPFIEGRPFSKHPKQEYQDYDYNRKHRRSEFIPTRRECAGTTSGPKPPILPSLPAS
jgi:hypothetical protein